MFCFWCLKLLCVKDKKYRCSHFWPCVQCNIEKLFHFFFTSVVCVDKPTDLSVCLSSYPSPFFRRKLSTNKTGKLFFFSFFYILFVVFLMKYNFGKKSLKMQNTKKKITKKYLKKSYTILSYLTQHKTQRNLGGVIFCRHMYKCKNAYVKMSMFRWYVLVCMHQYKLRKKPLFPAMGPFSPIGLRWRTTGTHSPISRHRKLITDHKKTLKCDRPVAG